MKVCFSAKRKSRSPTHSGPWLVGDGERWAVTIILEVGPTTGRERTITEATNRRSLADVFTQDGAKAAVDRAFANGTLIDFDLCEEGANDEDVVISLRFRHKAFLLKPTP